MGMQFTSCSPYQGHSLCGNYWFCEVIIFKISNRFRNQRGLHQILGFKEELDQWFLLLTQHELLILTSRENFKTKSRDINTHAPYQHYITSFFNTPPR